MQFKNSFLVNTRDWALRGLGCLLLFPDLLLAQVITDPDVNSWDEPGFLMVVVGLGTVVTLILLTILYEARRKKNRESS